MSSRLQAWKARSRSGLLLAALSSLSYPWAFGTGCSSDDVDEGTNGSGAGSGAGGGAGEGAGEGAAAGSGNGVSSSSGGDAASAGGAASGSGGDSSSAGPPTGSNGGEQGGMGGADESSAGGADPGALGPVLDDLIVTGAQAPLMPTFDAKHSRYSILAPDPVETISVTAVAADDLTLLINGSPAESGVAFELDDVEPGSDVEVTVTNDSGEARSYTIVYLPSDFPRFAVTVREAAASQDPIYLTTSWLKSGYVMKLDNFGVPLFYRSEEGQLYDFKKHPNGQWSYGIFRGSTTEHVVLDEHFEEVERVTAVGLKTDQHDFLILPNGNFIVLADGSTVRDMTAYGLSDAQTLIDGIFQEITPAREIVFQWNTWDHVNYADNLSKSASDYVHPNSVFVDADGDWLISLRHLAQVMKVDRDTGDVIWRLGGAAGDFTFVNDPYLGLCGQHSVSRTKAGTILMFDNGNQCYPGREERGILSRVAEYALDETAMTAELVWSYSQNTFAEAQGSAQRLDNGNTFVGWGHNQEGPAATEVDADGNVVFQLEAMLPDGELMYSYRAQRFPDD